MQIKEKVQTSLQLTNSSSIINIKSKIKNLKKSNTDITTWVWLAEAPLINLNEFF